MINSLYIRLIIQIHVNIIQGNEGSLGSDKSPGEMVLICILVAEEKKVTQIKLMGVGGEIRSERPGVKWEDRIEK